ncbi:hypothetical protein NQ318_004618 [Aromia moschata]|uniref:Uncharacterized protein n=1 Tax=Aromia moschata TaxID=1265417 RepID=A0AAV8Y446_9CUCU|nr:hypothetical protein NQ318_004618 [Aromia moschata]
MNQVSDTSMPVRPDPSTEELRLSRTSSEIHSLEHYKFIIYMSLLMLRHLCLFHLLIFVSVSTYQINMRTTKA